MIEVAEMITMMIGIQGSSRAGKLKLMLTKMQMDTEPDIVRKEIIKKEQEAEDNILPPDKQLSVPGRDTGES